MTLTCEEDENYKGKERKGRGSKRRMKEEQKVEEEEKK
jgi:hypothetical protein